MVASERIRKIDLRKYSLYIMSDPINFQSLAVGKTYTVHSYAAVKSKFGDTYILKVKDEENNEIFELWSTPSLSKYIATEEL